jgi:hypothetical protein
MDAKDWRFPMMCKTCGEHAAVPFRVSTEKMRLLVEIKCGGCEEQWTLDAAAPSPFLKAKRDRRRDAVPDTSRK